jgi:ubiquinone/menaquinone biosynthesis C-methylase UbiE
MNIPYYPTRKEAIKKLLQIYIPKSGARILDLGSGDARILIELAKRYDDISLYGIEKNPYLVEASIKRIDRLGLKNIRIINSDLFNINLESFDTIYAYLTRDALDILKPKLESFLQRGKEIYIYDISIPNLVPYEVYRIEGINKIHKLYKYRYSSAKD